MEGGDVPPLSQGTGGGEPEAGWLHLGPVFYSVEGETWPPPAPAVTGSFLPPVSPVVARATSQASPRCGGQLLLDDVWRQLGPLSPQLIEQGQVRARPREHSCQLQG